MSKGWRRLVVISCTLLLVGSAFLVLGMTVWAQEQPQPTEQPTGTEQQPAQTTQTAQPTQPQQQGLTVNYWEPQVGTRTVYYTEDINDIHGDLFGTSTLGYTDIGLLWLSRPNIVVFRVPYTANYTSSYYYTVEAISNMNPVYFDLAGPWYFNMTTPFKYIEEVIGIHEAVDAASFPQATYAVRYLVIGSGGERVWGTSYRSNDPTQQKWLEWGLTVEYFPSGEETSSKEIVHYRSSIDKKMPTPATITTFPLSVGTTGSVDAVYVEGGGTNALSGAGSYEVIAEGKITLPAGTFDALLLKGGLTTSPDGEHFTQLEYAWFVQNIGLVASADSLPNELGPTFEEATDIHVLDELTGPGAVQQK